MIPDDIRQAARAMARRSADRNTPAQLAAREKFAQMGGYNPRSGRKPRADLAEIDLTPRAVGFDLKLHGHAVAIPPEPCIVWHLDRKGRRTRASGPAHVVRSALRRNGYLVQRPSRAKKPAA